MKTNILQEVLPIFLGGTEEWPNGYSDTLSSVGGGLWGNVYGFDIETEGLNPYTDSKILSVGFSPCEKVSFTSLLGNEEDLNNLKSILNNPDIILVGHNIKFDMNWITVKLGIDVKCLLFDTMFAQYLIDENIESNSLGFLSQRFKDLNGYKDNINRNNLKLLPKRDLLLYNGRDSDASRRLYDVFVPKLRKDNMEKLMATASMVLPILSKMETRGVCLDKDYANTNQKELFNDLIQLRYDMSNVAGTLFNPDSPKSLSQVLYKNLKFAAVKYTENNQTSTDSETISLLYDQVTTDQQKTFLNNLIIYKKKMKLISTYYQPINKWTKYDGRVHPNFSLGKRNNEEGSGGTVTGRLSCTNPNLQNIPRGDKHRNMFVPTEGFTFIDLDFSQLELRVAAFLAKEDVMIDMFNKGLDIHKAVTAEMLDRTYDKVVSVLNNEKDVEYKIIKEQRTSIKRINFGILYGVGAHRLQKILRIDLGKQVSLQYCDTTIKRWLGKYKKIEKWIKNQHIYAVAHKEIGMPLGQKRRLPEANFHTPEGKRALRQATNFPVQSLASWICLIGLIILDNYFNENENVEGYILLQVHDSITSEVRVLGNLTTMDSIIIDIKNIMEKDILVYLKDVFNVDFNVPLEIEISIKDKWS